MATQALRPERAEAAQWMRPGETHGSYSRVRSSLVKKQSVQCEALRSRERRPRTAEKGARFARRNSRRAAGGLRKYCWEPYGHGSTFAGSPSAKCSTVMRMCAPKSSCNGTTQAGSQAQAGAPRKHRAMNAVAAFHGDSHSARPEAV